MFRAHGGRAPESVIDFSSPQNPLGPPRVLVDLIRELVDSRIYVRYPDYDYLRLRSAIAEYYNLNPHLIIPLNGSAEALNLLVEAVRPERIITIEPTFGDHRLYSAASGISWIAVTYRVAGYRFELDSKILCKLPVEDRRRALVIISNPNNPTGTLIDRKSLEEIVECLGENSVLVVDEAFADFTSNSESLLWSGIESIVIMRSLTKILSVPGLRIGFLYVHRERLARVVDSLRQPWNVNILAAEAMAMLLEDKRFLREFVEKSIKIVGEEREFLSRELRELGLKVYESTAPFILVEHSIPHPELNNLLVENGVYVRDASSFHSLTPYHSRVSVRLRDDNLKLVKAFDNVLKAYKRI